MDYTQVGAIGLCYVLVKVIEKLIDIKAKPKALNPYREDFLERLGAMMEANTKELNKISESHAKIEPLIVATDLDTNFPHIWTNHKQAKRTHENVNRVLEFQEELAKTQNDILKEVRNG